MLWRFRFNRQDKVRRLRHEARELQASLTDTSDKSERKKLRADLARVTSELEYQLGIPPITAEKMCSECPTPVTQHGWSSTGSHSASPCPAWPGWAARWEKAVQMMSQFNARHSDATQQAPISQPQPLAVLASGLPIADVVSQLAALQQQFPHAVVKRGRANRWELWPE